MSPFLTPFSTRAFKYAVVGQVVFSAFHMCRGWVRGGVEGWSHVCIGALAGRIEDAS